MLVVAYSAVIKQIFFNNVNSIAFIDLETTGINISNDRIVEIAIVKILADGTKLEILGR